MRKHFFDSGHSYRTSMAQGAAMSTSTGHIADSGGHIVALHPDDERSHTAAALALGPS